MHQACEPVLQVWVVYRDRFGVASTVAIFLLEAHAIAYCGHRNRAGETAPRDWLYHRAETVYSYVHEREACHGPCVK